MSAAQKIWPHKYATSIFMLLQAKSELSMYTEQLLHMNFFFHHN